MNIWLINLSYSWLIHFSFKYSKLFIIWLITLIFDWLFNFSLELLINYLIFDWSIFPLNDLDCWLFDWLLWNMINWLSFHLNDFNYWWFDWSHYYSIECSMFCWLIIVEIFDILIFHLIDWLINLLIDQFFNYLTDWLALNWFFYSYLSCF